MRHLQSLLIIQLLSLKIFCYFLLLFLEMSTPFTSSLQLIFAPKLHGNLCKYEQVAKDVMYLLELISHIHKEEPLFRQ